MLLVHHNFFKLPTYYFSQILFYYMPAIILILQYAYIYHLNLLKANLTLNLLKAISAVINSSFLYPNLIKNLVRKKRLIKDSFPFGYFLKLL